MPYSIPTHGRQQEQAELEWGDLHGLVERLHDGDLTACEFTERTGIQLGLEAAQTETQTRVSRVMRRKSDYKFIGTIGCGCYGCGGHRKIFEKKGGTRFAGRCSNRDCAGT